MTEELKKDKRQDKRKNRDSRIEDGTVCFFLKHENFFENPVSSIISWATQSDIYHVAIYCKGYLYEATKNNVGKKQFILDNYYKKDWIELYKLQEPLSEEKKSLLYEDLEKQLGKEYSVKQAIISAIDHIPVFRVILKAVPKDWKRTSKRAFCSKLVAYALEKATSFKFNKEDNLLTPAELFKKLKRQAIIKKL